MSGQLLHHITLTGLYQSPVLFTTLEYSRSNPRVGAGAPQPRSSSFAGSLTDLWLSLAWLSVVLSPLNSCSEPIQELGVGMVVVMVGERGNEKLLQAEQLIKKIFLCQILLEKMVP